ncbi:MAG TPA: sensor domain-containing diguanylate cyclase [Gemmatimonadales bacterium]|nr:sensor domain-containing diguanylate cyclase [Gemmatimonadales bacterium]
MSQPGHPRALLLGDPAIRPDGLERFLVREGFQLTEADMPGAGSSHAESNPPDLLIFAVAATGSKWTEQVKDLADARRFGGAPVFVLLKGGGHDAAMAALAAGAQDAMPVTAPLGELKARIEADARVRLELEDARETLRARDLLFDIFQEVSAALRAEEIFQTLVRRVGQAFGLSHCSFVLTAPGEDKGRVVAVYENPAIRDLRVELERYPEIQEAIRTERPVVINDVHEHPLFESIRKRWVQQQLEVNVQAAVALPVFVQGRAAGVFFLRTERGDPELRPQDVTFANTIAQAAARVLENEERRAAIYRRQISAGASDVLTGCASLDALDRRVRDEFERARRYQLQFCLVILDIDRLRDVNERLGQGAGDRVLSELGALLHREIRAPDFVARYGGDEFALILPETQAEGGALFVERLRGLIARHSFPDLGPGRVPSISAGVVAFPHSEVLRPEDLFTLVEAALSRGKASEPNRIGIAPVGK